MSNMVAKGVFMSIKKFVSIIIAIIMCCSIPLCCNAASPINQEISPLWTNTEFVVVGHQYRDGDSWCNVRIQGQSGTTSIDNIDIVLYKYHGSGVFSIVERWDDLSCTGAEFAFFDTVENVETGYTYRLEVSADVHRNGTIESICQNKDVAY